MVYFAMVDNTCIPLIIIKKIIFSGKQIFLIGANLDGFTMEGMAHHKKSSITSRDMISIFLKNIIKQGISS